MRLLISFLSLIFCTSLLAASLPIESLKLPPGVKLEIFAYPVPDARGMALGDDGTVYVGSRSAGKIYAIVPDRAAPAGKKILTIASGLNMPSGLAMHGKDLYVAAVGTIYRYDDIRNHLQDAKATIIRDDLPTDSHHGWRYMKFGPDDKIYIAIGMPCNVCEPKDERYGTIMRMNTDGSDPEIFARGIRNTVGFDWDKYQHLWFTENGQDNMGDDIPPDEINYAPVSGLHFGFPYMNGKDIPGLPTDKYSTKDFTPPKFELPAHVAAIGMTFIHGRPDPAHSQSFYFAEHGSWNRSSKVGYQVMQATIVGDSVVSVRPFITGWLQGQSAWGRPVDVMQFNNSLLISDDKAGVIYRVSGQIP